MSVYVLECDRSQEKAVAHAWRDWYIDPDESLASKAIVRLKRIDDSYLHCAVRVRPHKSLQRIILLIISVDILLAGLLMTHLTQTISFLTGNSGLFILLVIIPFLLVVTVMLALPYCILYGASGIFDDEEQQIIAKITDELGIEVFQTTLIRSWILFPGDATAIGAPFVLLIAALFIVSLSGAIFAPFLLPILLFSLFGVTSEALREISYARLVTADNMDAYWRLRAAELFGPFSLFLFPAFFYGFVTLFARANWGGLIWLRTAGFVTAKNLSDRLPVVFQILFDPGRVAAKQYTLGDSRLFSRIPAPSSVEAMPHTEQVGLAIAVFCVTLAILVGCAFSLRALLRQVQRWNTEWTGFRYLRPETAPTLPAVTRLSILLHWASRLISIAGGLLVVIAGLSWILTGTNNFLPSLLLDPFVFYQRLMQILLGTAIGSGIARVLLFLIIAPATLWIGMCVVSFACFVSAFLRVVVKRRHAKTRIHRVLDRLCDDLAVPRPFLDIDCATVHSPVTTAVIPTARCAVLRVSSSLSEELSDGELRVMLAHELAHTTRDLRWLWLAQMASRLSLHGPGYLTLLLNWWRIELDADAFAATKTGDRDTLAKLLKTVDIIEMRATVRVAQTNGSTTSEHSGLLGALTDSRIVRGLCELYRFYFGADSEMWGYFHPTTAERLTTLSGNKDHEAVSDKATTYVIARQPTIPNTVIPLIDAFHFSNAAAATLMHARQAAMNLNHDLGSEHLLLGLLAEGKGPVPRILAKRGVLLRAIRPRVAAFDRAGGNGALQEPELTPVVKRIVRLALATAERFEARMIDSTLILFALVSEESSENTSTLDSLGVDAGLIYRDLTQIFGNRAATACAVLAFASGMRSSQAVNKAFRDAEAEARSLNHPRVEPEHLILGCLLGSSSTVQALHTSGMDLPRARRAAELIIDKADRPPSGPLHITARTRQVIEAAIDEARRRGSLDVRTDHLLLGLTHHKDANAENIFERLGADAGAFQTVLPLLPQPSSADTKEQPIQTPSDSAASAQRVDFEQLSAQGAAADSHGSNDDLGRPIHSPERLSPRVRKVFSLAQEEAQQLNHAYVGSAHLLLALLREGEGIAAIVLANWGVQLPQLRGKVEFIIGRGDGPVVSEPGVAPDAKRAIELAMHEWRQSHDDDLRTEHLFLGVIHDAEMMAGGILESLGVNLDEARQQVVDETSQRND